MPDVTEQTDPRQRVGIQHREAEELRGESRAHLCRCRPGRHDALLIEARLAIVFQPPDVVRVDAGTARAPDAAQLVLRIEVEDVDAAVAIVVRLLADRHDRVAVLSPRAAVTRETVVVILLERLHAAAVVLHLRRDQLAENPGEHHQDHARARDPHRDTRDGHARCTHDDELHGPRHVAEREQRSDQRRDRQHVEGVFRQVQPDVQECVFERVRADTDLVLLRDEDVQAAQREQHEHDEQRGAEHGTHHVAAEYRGHAGTATGRGLPGGLSRTSSHSPTHNAIACTHHIPTSWGTTPLSTQVRAAAISCE